MSNWEGERQLKKERFICNFFFAGIWNIIQPNYLDMASFACTHIFTYIQAYKETYTGPDIYVDIHKRKYTYLIDVRKVTADFI